MPLRNRNLNSDRVPSQRFPETKETDEAPQVRQQSRLIEDLNAIVRKYNKLPNRDNRTADEIVGYNEWGHFD